jgi:hypothetical protein
MFTDDMTRLKTKLANDEITYKQFRVLVKQLIKDHVGTGLHGRPTTTLTQKITKLSLELERQGQS